MIQSPFSVPALPKDKVGVEGVHGPGGGPQGRGPPGGDRWPGYHLDEVMSVFLDLRHHSCVHHR